jgi:hypothetical protein
MGIYQQLPTGTPVTIYGQHGRVLYYSVDGLIAVRLAGEIRVDLWSPEQVEVAS